MGITLSRGDEPVPGYTLRGLIGRGGFGEVWKATGPGGFQVALKFVLRDEAVGAVELRALETIKDIRHPHLVATFGSWQVESYLVVAMELADRTLLERFREAVGQGFKGIPVPEVLEHFLDAARGLDYLNEPRHPSGGGAPQGIQHRDIKPQNILLVGGCVKVADFGLARVLEHSQTGHTGGMTPAYAAPEFFDRKTSSQSDQYSLAVTYCHMRGGRLPFEGSPMEIMSGHVTRPPDLSMLPARERAAVARALAKNPKERWPSCRAFVKAIGDGEPVEDGLKTETLRQAPRAGRVTGASAPARNGASQEEGRTVSLGIGEGRDDRDRRPGVSGRVNRWLLRGALLGAGACVLGALVLMLGQGATSQGPPTAAPIPIPRPVRDQSASTSPLPDLARAGTRAGSAPLDVVGGERKTMENSIGMKLVLIPAGEFAMGSGDDDKDAQDHEKPRHRVRITRPFYLGATEVTRGWYRVVIGKKPIDFQGLDDLPVEQVSWHDAIAFCNALSERESLTPYYRFDEGKWSGGSGYRLPTEAEWEYACRGGPGGTGVYSFGDDASKLGQYDWYRENSDSKTHPVGHKAPNGFGLYDMHGNVCEWCWDGFDVGYYAQSPSADPSGPSQASVRVIRGGCWNDFPRYARSAIRIRFAPDVRFRTVGFRVARGQSAR